MMAFKDLLGKGPLGAITEIWTGRQKRKAAEKTLEAKIAEKKLDAEAKIDFAPHEWERLAAWANESTWKDEYVTVSVVSIFNLIVVGGLASAFGYPQILNGVTQAVMDLNSVLENPDGSVTQLGIIISATIFAAIGVYGWKKLVN